MIEIEYKFFISMVLQEMNKVSESNIENDF